MADTNQGVITKARVLIVLIVIFILGFVFFFIDTESIWQFIQWVLFLGFIAAIFGGVVYLLWTLFFKPQKVDITYFNKKKLVAAAKISKPPFITDLWVSGDSQHQRFNVGKIIGWTRIQVYDLEQDVSTGKIKDSKGNLIDMNNRAEVDKVAKIAEEDVFVVQRVKFPFSWFIDPLVIRVRPKDHTALVGDVILKGFSFNKFSEYLYLNHEMLNIVRLDYNILREAERGILPLLLSDLKTIVDSAIGVNPRHNLEMESSKLMKLPTPPPARPET